MSAAIKNVKSLAPLLDRILVQRIKAASQTASGIYIPEKNVEKLNEANVLAVGPGAPNMKGDIVPTSVKAGDKVLIPPFGGSSIKIGDEVSIIGGIKWKHQWMGTKAVLQRSMGLSEASMDHYQSCAALIH